MNIRLVHISDVHFGCENAAAVDAAVGAVRALAPDLTIVSGDLTASGRRDEFEAARAWLARLPQPQIATPGNHDVPRWSLPGRLASPFRLYRNYVGPDKTAAYLPGLTVRALNMARGVQLRTDWSKGAISLSAVKAAAEDMRVATKALKVLVCHHPLIEPTAAAVTGGVHRGAAAARILAEAGVDLILSGHSHDPFVIPAPVGRGGPEGVTYAVGAGTLSLRTRQTRPGFSVIEANAGAIRVRSLVWTGAAFEAGAVWTLPRRAPLRPVRRHPMVAAPRPVLTAK